MTKTILKLDGEYVVCWNDEKHIVMGPEQVFGDLFTSYNVFTDASLLVVEEFISNNSLIKGV